MEQIMRFCKEGKAVFGGIHKQSDVYALDLSAIASFGEVIDVVDDEGVKVGEVRKRVLEKVLKSSICAHLHLALDLVAVGVAVIDTDGMIVYMNEPYSVYMGYAIAEALGGYFKDLNPKAMVLRVLKSGKAEYFDDLYVERSGMFISGCISPFYIEGVYSGVVTSFTEIKPYERRHKKKERTNRVEEDLQQQFHERESLRNLEIFGNSSAFSKTLDQAFIVANTDVPVLIRGENGSGKEKIAMLIHQSSSRRNKAFVVVNCAAIPENLLESELFGYEAGAFTGATAKGKTGKFELAHGGTLFLDEIGDLPLSMQPKVLRAIQENEIEKLGTEKKVSVDIRIIAATNQPLEQMIEKKLFRMDLFYRINTVSIMVPPLRERPEDILLMINVFLDACNEKYGKRVGFSESAIRLLCKYSWPGNVRELRNFVEHSVIMSTDGQVVEDSELLENIRNSLSGEAPAQKEEWMRGEVKVLAETLDEIEKVLIKRALAAYGYDKSKTMKALGLSRRTFYRKLQKHEL